jgi:hypothetical protein
MENLGAGEREAVRKDLLLIEGALDDGRRVVSRDAAMRRILHRMAQDLPNLSTVHWVGPEHDKCLTWLAAGAPDDPDLMLAKSL